LEKKALIREDKLREFIYLVLSGAGVRDDVATILTEGVLFASIRGIDSHGVRLLPHYVKAVESGRINPNPHYKFEQTLPGTGLLDADHTFGHAAGMEAMHRAMEMANKVGAGLVGVYNSSHFGSAAFFVVEAAKNDFIGFAFTHANSLLNTPGSTRPFFGLNPVAMAAPCDNEEPFCFDSAPSLISWNKLLQLRQMGLKAPPFSGADEFGNETEDPQKITQLIPIGGYKGFGLAMMVDILCGLLTGMPVGREISNMYETPLSERRYLGQFYIAIKIEAFQPVDVFKKRLKKLMDEVRNEPRKDPDIPILVPGDPEKQVANERRRKGILLGASDLEALESLGRKYQVKLIK
jgi:ureidoglycolate dehydrogenase (NAD+)